MLTEIRPNFDLCENQAMSLDLNERQRAMLAEMDVRLWWPQTDTDPRQNRLTDLAADATADRADSDQAPVNTVPVAPVNVPVRHRPVAVKPAGLASGPTPVELLPLPGGIETMDWPALRASVASCQACPMCLGRRTPVLAAPPEAGQAHWLVLGEPPDPSQEHAGQPFVDEAGLLLDNMLKAVGVSRAKGDAAKAAYLSLVLKCRPALPTAPDEQVVAACATYLRREIALVQPKVILAMGRLAMQVLLSEDHPQGLKLPLGKLRGQVWHYQGVPVVVTYPPAYLLRNGQDKGRAWADLCLAQAVVQGKLPG